MPDKHFWLIFTLFYALIFFFYMSVAEGAQTNLPIKAEIVQCDGPDQESIKEACKRDERCCSLVDIEEETIIE